jgi:hypothetical protein
MSVVVAKWGLTRLVVGLGCVLFAEFSQVIKQRRNMKTSYVLLIIQRFSGSPGAGPV